MHHKAKAAKGSEQVRLYVLLSDQVRRMNADTGLFFSSKAYELAQETNTPLDIMLAGHSMGKSYSIRGSYVVAQKFYTKVFDIADETKNDSMKARGLLGIGNSFWHLGKHAASLEKLFAALQLSEQTKLPDDIVSAKINIALVYQSQEKPELAEKYVEEALAQLKTMNKPDMQITAMHTLANVYGMQGKISEAMKLDEEGIKLAEATNNEFSKALFYDNMANCYLFGNPPDYPKAIEYFQKTLLIDSSFDNKKQMSDSYKNLGSVFTAQQKYSDAIPYVVRSVTLARESGFSQGAQQGYELLAKLYNRTGQSALAFEALQKSMVMKDSLVNLGSEARIAELQTFYETEKQKQTIELQETQLSKKNYILAATIVTALLLGLLGFSGYRRYRLKQKAKLQAEIMRQQELATRAVIEAEEAERQRIARDLHDGVGQMMSAAKMNLSAFESEMDISANQKTSFQKIIGLVDESCREVRNVSHNMMPNALLKNNLATAIRDFIDKLDKKSLRVHLYTEGLDERLDANVEMVFYRVIQECVNNVIKHAGATTLDISLLKEQDGINATIEDNGNGFDTSLVDKKEGIGLKNIITRIEYLKGTVDFDSAPGRGTVVALHVPLR